MRQSNITHQEVLFRTWGLLNLSDLSIPHSGRDLYLLQSER